MLAALAHLEEATGRRFGDHRDPLLVSVRSGAAQSMPGMMDTILNLGITDGVEAALAAASGDAAFARDTHRRFRESYARLVGHEAPADPHEQLRAAICTVFASWGSPRAVAYRNYRGLSHDGGTAVTVQAMVYGNLDDLSGTGVLFTRDPQSGHPEPMGEFLPRGQGEDVVSGEVDPLDLAALAEHLPECTPRCSTRAGPWSGTPATWRSAIEFTVERGRLYLLQTRVAKRSARAAIRIAADLVDEGMLTPAEALARIRAEHVETVLRPVLDPEVGAGVRHRSGPRGARLPGHRFRPGREPMRRVRLTVEDNRRGSSSRRAHQPVTAVRRGSARKYGAVSTTRPSPTRTRRRSSASTGLVLVRHSTSPEDVHGMIAAKAVCTEHGGRTSHAAVVSRELGRPAVAQPYSQRAGDAPGVQPRFDPPLTRPESRP